MPYRSLLVLFYCLPLYVLAQGKTSFGPLFAIGTSGVQESLRESNDGNFPRGIRLSRAYKFGAAVSREFGAGGRSLTAEVAWLNTETRSVERVATQVRPRMGFERTVDQTRFTGGHLNLLFRQRLVTERTLNPLLELGVGAFFPGAVRQRFSRTNQPNNQWHDFPESRIRAVQWQPMAGFGVQWSRHFSITFRLTVPLENLLEDQNFFCIDFCPPTNSLLRRDMGLHTQQLQLGYLF